MTICKRVPDLARYPRPKNIPVEEYSVFDLQGANNVKYYVHGKAHGFRTADRIITDTRYTSLHRGFNINGVDKYALGYLKTHDYNQNNYELINLKSGKRAIELFSAYKAGEYFLAFRINAEDGDITKHRWGLYNMVEDRIYIKPVITSDCISTVFDGCEAIYHKQFDAANESLATATLN